MEKITNAVILAAGKSRRLGSLTESMPKCLLPLGDKTIMEHQIENLRSNGIEHITIVTGFCDAMIRERFGDGYTYIENEVYDRTNSIYSLWLALKEIKGGVIVLNSDVVFHPEILGNLLASPHPDALAICFQNGMADEEMKVKVQDEKIIDISKQMDPADADGENLGVVKFSANGVKVLFDKVDELVGQGTVNAWAPLAFQEICADHPLYAVATGGLPWIEIDFPEDYEAARDAVYPKICRLRT